MRRKYGLLFLLIFIVASIISLLTIKDKDPLYNYLGDKTDWKILSVSKTDGAINVDLQIMDDPGWLREDFIWLETKNLYNELKHLPPELKDEYFKEVIIRFITDTQPRRKVAELRITRERLFITDWFKMDVDQVVNNLDGYFEDLKID